ncbi:hypothetical protein D2E70_16280 [Mycobacteroides abscessus]|uniref:hypothetical protein n=1 Tax=Mycobacteroides abscessus TaxID=36809 RepID=UPI000E67A422|nr:hypothetical protein [Mycobacteroides abscessus]RIS67529.1 hypothetical protein D2E70_16280 [Mycobacteroides abscessus]
MTEKTNITVKDRAGFQQTLNTLSTLHGQIDAKLEEGQKLITALQAAASKNVVASESTGTQSGTGQSTVAPAYRGTVASTATAMTNLGTQVAAAKTSVGNVITNLQSILSGVTSIDEDGKAKVASS